MARVIWAEPALQDLDVIADYIALDRPDAARKLVQNVFARVGKLQRFPRMGSVPPELSDHRTVNFISRHAVSFTASRKTRFRLFM